MVTCRDIAAGALQLLGAYGGNEEPSAEDGDTAMLGMQSMYDTWVFSGMFGRLDDVYKTSDYTAKERERITVPNGVIVTIPDTVRSNCFYGSLRAPRDLSVIEVFDGSLAVWLFDRNAWVRIDGLTLDSEAPLASRGTRGLQACLAVTLAGDFNMQITPSIARLSGQFKTALSMKLGSTQDPAPVDYM